MCCEVYKDAIFYCFVQNKDTEGKGNMWPSAGNQRLFGDVLDAICYKNTHIYIKSFCKLLSILYLNIVKSFNLKKFNYFSSIEGE